MAVITSVAGIVLLNVLAYQHAHSMLTFSTEPVAAMDSPESLSTLGKVEVLLCGVNVLRPQISRTPANLDLPSEVIQFTSGDGVRLEGWLIAPQHPRGTVLLFHGYSASRSTVLDQARVFYDLGYAALPIDFRGGGGSEGHVTTLGIQEAEDVAAAVRFVRQRGLPQPLVLFGQSMGGAAVLRSVALLDVEPDAIIVESVFGRMLGTVRNRFELMGAPSFPAADLLVFWGSVQMGVSGFEHNPIDYARHCNCPALVLHGADDPRARLSGGKAIYENLPGAKQMEIFDGATHELLIAAAPEHWKSAVERFLSSVMSSEKPD